MPKKTEQKQIEGHTFRVTQFGGVEAFEVIARIGIGVGMKDLLPADLVWLREKLVNCTEMGVVDTHGGGKMNFVPLLQMYDDHFAGNHKAMFQWLQFAFEVNFGPFVDVLPAIVRVLRGLSVSKFQTAATGASGASSSPNA